MTSKSDLVKNAPTLLHAVGLVQSTQAATVLKIRGMNRSIPPDLYSPATDIILAVLRGRSHRWGLAQAETLAKPGQKECAKSVLAALKPYLLATRPDWVRTLDIEHYQAGADLQIPVRLAGLMKVGDRFAVLVLQLWKKGLTEEQRRAALTIIRNRIALRPELADAELHLLDVSVPEGGDERLFQQFGWNDVLLMEQGEIDRFVGRLYAAWKEYQANPEPKRPRRPRPTKDQNDMFGRDNPDDPPS